MFLFHEYKFQGRSKLFIVKFKIFIAVILIQEKVKG